MPTFSLPTPPTTLAQALHQAKAAGLDALDAEWLLLHAMGRRLSERAWLRAHDTDALPPEVQARFAQSCVRRGEGEPLAYLTGWRGFYGLELAVDARVLDPRPDTETLVDWAVAVVHNRPSHPSSAPAPAPVRVIDLGTGSGAIALALKDHCPHAEVWAVDASAEALEVARANAQRLGLAVTLAHSDWLAAVVGPWDVIVSNPPYIAHSDAHLLALQHEPRHALVSGPDGLDDIRRIVQQAPHALVPGGWLLLEHGHDQAPAVAALLRAQGFESVQCRHDLAGIARCTGGQWPLVAKGR